MLAQRELKDPIGWSWSESYTDTSPKKAADGNGKAAAPANDQKMMLQKPPPKRPPPKL